MIFVSFFLLGSYFYFNKDMNKKNLKIKYFKQLSRSYNTFLANATATPSSRKQCKTCVPSHNHINFKHQIFA